MTEGAFFFFGLLLMLVGLAGTILPILPGLPVVWLGALVYFLGSGMAFTDIFAFIVLTVIAIAGAVLSIVVPGQKSRSAGAKWSSIALGFVGAIVGAFLIPVVGVVVGGIAGVYLGERMGNAGHPAAWQATLATIKGMGWAFVFQFTSSVVLIAGLVTWGALSNA